MTFEPSIYIQVLISPLVAELLKYSAAPLTLFPGTSQVKMSALMSSLTSEADSLRCGVQHYILCLKLESKQSDEKVGKHMKRRRQEREVDLTLKPAELSTWSSHTEVMTGPV